MKVLMSCPMVKMGLRPINIVSMLLAADLGQRLGPALIQQRQATEEGKPVELLTVELPEAPEEIVLQLAGYGQLALAADGVQGARQIRVWAPLALSPAFRARLSVAREERRQRGQAPGTLFWVRVGPGQPAVIPLPGGDVRLELA